MMVPRKVQPQNAAHPSEIWVYVPYGIKRLQIQHPRYGTVDYSIGISVEKACTYVLELVACGPGTVNQQWLVISVEPRDALVEIDGIPVDNVDGEAGKFLQFGRHTYNVSADGYHSVSGEVVVNDPYKKVETSVRLLSAYGFVEIGNAAETEGAYLYVDGKSMGTLPVPVQKLIGGTHELRIVKPRYLPFSRTAAATACGRPHSGRADIGKHLPTGIQQTRGWTSA